MYTKTSWVARVGTALNRFLKTNETSTEVELTNDPTGVTTAGTPFTVANMNKIEDGIYDAHYPEFTEAATLTNIASGEVGTTLWGKVKKAIARVIVHDGWLNQGVKTTDNVGFANINPPVDNNDDSMPNLGIGGFTFVRSSTPIHEPTVTLQATGTFVCVVARLADDGFRDCFVSRYEGGSVVHGLVGGKNGLLSVLIFRIA